MREEFTLRLKGALHQGGFMPLLWRLVSECGYVVSGHASYEGEDVILVLEGEGIQVMNFLRLLPRRIPTVYKLSALTLTGRKRGESFDLKHRGFRIRKTESPVPEMIPDRVPCEKCKKELLDKNSARYLYPFFACKDCGPSYVFANKLPYERNNTSLVSFPACNTCKSEMRDPGDVHHYNAQLLCCPKCGPQHFVLDLYGDLWDNEEPFRVVRKELAAGKILAMQSVYGGFRLLTNALDEAAIKRFRKKKKWPDMSLGLLFKDMETIEKYCVVSEEEKKLLLSPVGPDVLLRRKKVLSENVKELPACIAPDSVLLRVGLPSSLSDELLFTVPEGEQLENEMPDVLINCEDNFFCHAECQDTDEIFNRLMSYSDLFLCHDMKNNLACPNSLYRVVNGKARLYRRGRGLGPLPVPGTRGLSVRRVCAAFGTDARSSVALASHSLGIVPSQEAGYIFNEAGAQVLPEMLDVFIDLYDTVPQVVACDMNSSLFSTKCAVAFAKKYQLPVLTVQTHHALALACMAEHGLENALAFVFTKGKGAPDGTYWGAECLEAKGDSFSRYASFAPQATCCRKNDFSGIRPSKLLLEWFFDGKQEVSDGFLARLNVERSEEQEWRKNYNNNPSEREITHSAEYIFTAVTVLLGLAPSFCTFPGRCRGILENMGEEADWSRQIPQYILEKFVFRLEEEDGCCFVNWKEMIFNLAETEVIADEEKVLYVRAFYLALSEAVLAMIRYAAQFTDEKNVVLSGDVFIDGVLSRLCKEKLEADSFTVYQHEYTSPDASSVCIGQAYAALLT